MTPTWLNYGALGLCAIILSGAYRLIDKMATRWMAVADGFSASLAAAASASAARDKELVQHLSTISTGITQVLMTVQRIEAHEVTEAESNRFMKDTIKNAVEYLGKIMQHTNNVRVEQPFRDETIDELHTMTTDMHREIVKRDTGVHRLSEIEKRHRERQDR